MESFGCSRDHRTSITTWAGAGKFEEGEQEQLGRSGLLLKSLPQVPGHTALLCLCLQGNRNPTARVITLCIRLLGFSASICF